MADLVWLAILVQIASVSLLNIGSILQKRGADQLPSVHDTSLVKNITNFLKNRTWIAGYLFIMLGSIGSFVALGFADFSILQPFMAVGIVVQAIACRWYLKEVITRQQVVAMVLMIGGVVFVGISTVPGEQDTWTEVITLISRPLPLVFLILLAVAGIFAYLFTKFKGYEDADIWISIFTGIFSVYSYLFAKVVMAAVVTYGITIALLTDIIAWVMLVIAFIASTAAFLSKNISYQHGRAVLINNIFNAFNIALPVLVGVVVLDEWVGASATSVYLQTIGVIIIMTGVILMMIVELKVKDVKPHLPPPSR